MCFMCSDSNSSNKKKIGNHPQILDYDSMNLFYVDLGTWNEYVPINCLRHITDRFHQHLVFFLSLVI